MEEAIHPPRLFAIDVHGRIEVLDFAADLDVEVARLEALDQGDARATVDNRVPGRGHVQADRCDCSHTGDHDPSQFIAFSPGHLSRRPYSAEFCPPLTSSGVA